MNNLAGKAACKRALQREFLLAEDAGAALFGTVGRLVHQKGFELIACSIESMLTAMRVQFVMLGTGEGRFEHYSGNFRRAIPAE